MGHEIVYNLLSTVEQLSLAITGPLVNVARAACISRFGYLLKGALMSAGTSLGHRQVHLDFHTPGGVADIASEFDPEAFARTIKEAHIDSVTVFSRCHHGFSYHPTSIGTMHPGLSFDLLGAQIRALKAVGVRSPIYITVGWDELAADTHPEWLQRDARGEVCRSRPGDLTSWRFLDLASPYVDYVLALTEEVLDRFEPVDGIFFDIVRQSHEAVPSFLQKHSVVDEVPAGTDSLPSTLRIERSFLDRASRLVRDKSSDATIFFNSRLRPDRFPELGSRAELPWYSHIEIESLPSGEWGYNHYPLFASYFQTLALPMLGMTGVFHTSWGDFGAVKTQSALDFECSRMIASGASCSIGDHLHPNGVLDSTVYDRIGHTYAHVEALEPWCEGAQAVPEVGIVMAESGARFDVTGRDTDEGVMRMMLEQHRPFQFLDLAADLSPYQVLILPDDVSVSDEYAGRLQEYLAQGGAILLTHRSGLRPDGSAFAHQLAHEPGVTYLSEAAESPDYLVASEALDGQIAPYPLVLRERGSLVDAGSADVLAHVGLPYFSRTPQHFFGHRHAPFKQSSQHPAVTQRGRAIYCHSPLFSAYRRHAIPAYRHLVGALLDRLISDPVIQTPGLPSTAEVSLHRQPGHDDRYVLHIIHAVPQRRGEEIDIVEDSIPIRDCRVGIRTDRPVDSVLLAPEDKALPYETEKGVTWFTVPEVSGHQVIALSLAPTTQA